MFFSSSKTRYLGHKYWAANKLKDPVYKEIMSDKTIASKMDYKERDAFWKALREVNPDGGITNAEFGKMLEKLGHDSKFSHQERAVLAKKLIKGGNSADWQKYVE
jgi:hypothetical protein